MQLWPTHSLPTPNLNLNVQVSKALVTAAKNESEENFQRRKRAREHEMQLAEDSGVEVRAIIYLGFVYLCIPVLS